jgi:tetratricopeptide (TPR) repeat protein
MANLAETLASARQYHEAGEWNRAEPLYRQILYADPFNAEVEYLLSLICRKQGKSGEALTHLATARRLRPDFAVALWERGLALAVVGRDEEARNLREATSDG